MSDVVYKASLDDTEVARVLARMDKNIEKIADRGDKAFGQVEKGAKRSGVQIGAVSGIVQELTRRFIDLGLRAVAVFGQITARGIKLNEAAENIEIALTQIFEGNRAAALAFLELVDQTAVKLGVSREELRGLAKSILPDVGSIDKTNKILEQMIILGRDAAQNMTSIRIAVEEALASGGERAGLISLQRRLNVPPESIDRIVELSKEIGLADALIEVLGDRIVKAGLSIEAFGDSFSLILGQAQSELTVLNKTFGEAPFEELKEQIKATLEVFDDNRDDIENVAEAFGELAAKVIELVGGGLRELLNNLDYEALEQTADNFSLLVSDAQLLAEILFDPDLLNNLISGSNQLLETLDKALITASQIFLLDKAQAARVKAEAEALAPAVERSLGEVDTDSPFFQPLLFRDIGKLFATAEEEAKAAAAGQEAYNEIIRGGLEAYERREQAEKDLQQAQEDRRKENEKGTDADKEAGDAIIDRKKQLEDLARAESDANKALEKINEDQAEFAREFQERLTKIQIGAERDRIDDLIKNAQKREDIARENAQEIEDIFRDHNQEIEDAARDLSRDEADIARKAARDRQEVERDLANDRIDIERDFRQELLRIQQQFDQAAEEAERNNDAQAFLRAVRNRDAQIEQAQLRRNENVEESKIEAERRREELKKQLDFELEDARIANQRKLEDLQISLDRKLEAQRIELERELEEQRIAEERQAQERQLALQRALDDFARANAAKREDLQRSLEEELKTVQAFEKAKADVAIAEARRAAETIRKIRESILAPFSGGGQAEPFPLHLPLITRQHGGPVQAGQPAIVGEAGPEMFVPDQSGTIIPNDALFRPPVQSASIQQVQHSSRSASASFQMTDFQSMMNDPVSRASMKDFVLSVFGELGL